MNILHLDNNHPLLLEQLEAAGFTNHVDSTSDYDQVIAKIEAYQGIVVRSRIRIDAAFLDKASNLQFIARVGAGVESIDTQAAAQKGVRLFSAPEGNRNAVGEHALGMLLALTNNLIRANAAVKSGHWNREQNRGIELEGKTVGLIGYGNMGKAFAKKLQGFDCEVICYDIIEGVGDHNATQVSLKTLQQKAQVLSLHTPWTPITNKMVDAAFIDSFTNPFYFINTARGKNVVTKDLVAALQSEQILGAGLDVLEYEKSSFESLFENDNTPEALTQLMRFDNVILSPHIAGWTIESKRKLAQTIVDKIIENFKP
ncbi:MAG: 2-hydroxyacid dehydrogenase [Gilvibacter sp.]